MSPMLATASAVISLALVAYTIGVFSERRSGELKRSHLVLFWLGLICDSTGTGLMSIMAQNSGGAMSPLHPVTGFLAIALMLFHAVWAPTSSSAATRRPAAASIRSASACGWCGWSRTSSACSSASPRSMFPTPSPLPLLPAW